MRRFDQSENFIFIFHAVTPWLVKGINIRFALGGGWGLGWAKAGWSIQECLVSC